MRSTLFSRHAIRTSKVFEWALCAGILTAPLCALTAPLDAQAGATGRLTVSEVMADPAAVADAMGEFIELANPGADSAVWTGFFLGVDGQELRLPAIKLKPYGVWLVCRNSDTAVNGGMQCNLDWPAMSLANGRNLLVTLRGPNAADSFSIPISRAGVSWENTFSDRGGIPEFLHAVSRWRDGDSATPGKANSRSSLPNHRVLDLDSPVWEKSGWLSLKVVLRSAAAPGTFPDAQAVASKVSQTVTGLGSQTSSFAASVPASNAEEILPSGLILVVRLDQDFDGIAETFLDSLELPPHAASPFQVRTACAPGLTGVAHVILQDASTGTMVSSLAAVGDGPALRIEQACPAPIQGAPEWVGIRNVTDRAGRTPRNIKLGDFVFQGMRWSDDSNLPPGGFLVLTGDTAALLRQYGPMAASVRRLSPWPALRNSGDTLRISAGGWLMDSAVYGATDLSGARGCLERADGERFHPAPQLGLVMGVDGNPSPPDSTRAPGLSDPVPKTLSWEFSGSVASAARSLTINVDAPIGVNFHVRIFNLEGDIVRDLGEGGAGHLRLAWDGRGTGGNTLRPGPYIICLNAAGRSPRKRVVLVSEKP